MRHIASCAGGNAVREEGIRGEKGEEERGERGEEGIERDWIGQSVREESAREEEACRNNVPAHFLKLSTLSLPPCPSFPGIRRRSGGQDSAGNKKKVTDA